MGIDERYSACNESRDSVAWGDVFTSSHTRRENSRSWYRGQDIPGKEAEMLNVLRKLVRDEAGQDLAEYGIALAIIAVGAGAIAVAIATDVETLWSNAQDDIATAAN